jgi:hypothetical protein
MCGVPSSASDGFRSSAKSQTSSVFRNDASGFGSIERLLLELDARHCHDLAATRDAEPIGRLLQRNHEQRSTKKESYEI